MTAWFFCPYVRRVDPDNPADTTRAPLILEEFGAQIDTDGGAITFVECLGNSAVCKVSASTATLNAIAARSSVQRLPVGRLDDPLSSLTGQQRTAIRNRLLAQGWSSAEITSRLGDLATRTLRDVFRMAVSRRLKPRYDAVGDQIVLDGARVDPPADTLLATADEAIPDS